MPSGSKPAPGRRKPAEPTIENRRARHDYFIEETLECGIRLVGTEVKSVRRGQMSLGEGYARATLEPLALELHGVHIGEYAPAGPHRQHVPTRARTLLAQKREIRKLADRTRQGGLTLIPLKAYFVRGRVKVLIGLARGKRKADKRQSIATAEARRDIDRAMSRRG
jgi:SsrA-binding protein